MPRKKQSPVASNVTGSLADAQDAVARGEFEQLLFVGRAPSRHLCCGINYPAMTQREFALIVGDLVRHGARAYGVPDETLWVIIDQDRIDPEIKHRTHRNSTGDEWTETYTKKLLS